MLECWESNIFYGWVEWNMQEPTVADMSIADEHIVVEMKTRISEVCKELAVNPDHAILVKKGSEIRGVVTARSIFQKMSEGVNATKVKVSKIMRTNILSIPADTPLSLGLDLMSKENPDAIIITGDEGDFVGYFSTSDYRDATRRLEAHQKMASRLKRSRKVITEKAEEKDSNVDLLDLLLGDVEEEEEEVDSLSTLSFE
ncbi:MAG: CBS domain-containing protein [Candidatus Poseidoniaceae archaeon]